MTSQEVVMHVIDKAKKSAWREGDLLVGHVAWSFNGGRVLFTLHYEGDIFEPNHKDLYGLIFIHGFAKAVWGKKSLITREDKKDLKGGTTISIITEQPEWRYHLKEMVLQKDPIDYLKRFI